MTENSKRTIGLIWSQTRDRVIGANGGIPWQIPEDVQHFQDVTSGRTIIMGRRTWDALPDQARVAPDRRTIVITRNPEWFAPGAESADSMSEALALTDPDEVWVLGGAEIFAAAVEFATVIVVTEVDAKVSGDAYAPRIPPEFVLAFTTGITRSTNGKDSFQFRSYARK
ncbi:dihydrofolate reductase [Nocardia jiangxiensis]|uniref:dihydrofolate reductase n=1 Tax=Nocardia jiangxiensis TaxID=282685 RepID=UPI000316A9E6|nr:dihydrofolate reductase [Nocardia jiangxiensis]